MRRCRYLLHLYLISAISGVHIRDMVGGFILLARARYLNSLGVAPSVLQLLGLRFRR